MIIYATKQTFERYKLKLPSELSHPIKKKLRTGGLACQRRKMK